MQYRIDLKSGNRLSALGYGCMRLPRGASGMVDADKSEKLILEAIERGVNYFDTAYIYGGSEQALGEVLRRNDKRREVYIATKLPHYRVRAHEDFGKYFETQLGRLKTDYIDYYLLHNVASLAQLERLRALGLEEWVARERERGRIFRFGFSFHGQSGEFRSLIDANDWDFCQIQYNYLDEHNQAGRAGLEYAASRNIPVIIMEPLLGGRLAGNVPRGAGGVFRAADSGKTYAAWALRWLWDQPGVTVVLSGMCAVAQLRENLETCEEAPPGCLSDAEREVYPRVIASFRESYKVDCTGCSYCMPCPMGVNIPGSFEAYNRRYAVGFVAGMQSYIMALGLSHTGKSGSGRQCAECGACAKKCPQGIAIPEKLAEAVRRMEPPIIRGAIKIIQRVLGK